MSRNYRWRSSGDAIAVRSWREIGLVDRTFRIITFVGMASFVSGWLLELWLQSAAFQQPRIPNGVYQNVWFFKGRVYFLTDSQFTWAHYVKFFLSGFAPGSVGLIWTGQAESRAKSHRINEVLHNFQLKSDD